MPTNLRVPGSVYCAGADCTGKSIQSGPATSDPPSVCTTSTATPPITTCSTQLSSGRIDNPWTGGVEGWQGFPGQNNFLEFGKEPYVAGENGGIKGHVIYASTRPFDDPMMLVQTQWEPLVPHVTINLYQEGLASDGVTPTLTLVDTTQTSSWDDYAQGFRADGVTPNMNCPGQGASSGAIPDLFYFSLYNQPNYLNFYNSQHGGPALTPLPDNSQFKCYDGMHNWNQIQPAPYDGMYKFPSVTAVDANGKPTLAGTNCTICTANPAVPTTDLYCGIPHAARRQVRGGSGSASGLRTGQGRGQEHPHRRQLHRSGNPGVWRVGQHLHHSRPGLGGFFSAIPWSRLQRQQRPESHHEPWDAPPAKTSSRASSLSPRGRASAKRALCPTTSAFTRNRSR